MMSLLPHDSKVIRSLGLKPPSGPMIKPTEPVRVRPISPRGFASDLSMQQMRWSTLDWVVRVSSGIEMSFSHPISGRSNLSHCCVASLAQVCHCSLVLILRVDKDD